MPRRWFRRFILLTAFLAGTIFLVLLTGLALDFPLILPITKGLLAGAVLLVALWLAWRALQLFLWRVGRRLAFSYLLIGAVPIPMLALLVLLNGYLVAGYFLGHLYRDAVAEVHRELELAAGAQLEDVVRGLPLPPAAVGGFRYAAYRDGRRLSGDEGFPEAWPGWLAEPQPGAGERLPMASYVLPEGGSPTLAAAAARERWGVVALLDWGPDGGLEETLAARSDVAVRLLRADDPRTQGVVRLQFAGRTFSLLPAKAMRSLQAASAEDQATPIWRRPLLWWAELSGPLHDLDDGAQLAGYMAASLNATPQTVARHLLSGSAEVDTAVWASLIAVTGLLGSIYGVAIVMAFLMILGLSRAVNRLSRATEAVRGGDFAARIPVTRRDQVGELHRSFNEMAANLERSVAAVAQKEVLEKELQIARDLQQSLLPSDIPSSETVEFATLFEPSAAIGGDYFDILRVDENRLVVVIADVSGHGLPTGLRMAMLKAALVILVEEGKPPEEILRRLSRMVRQEQEGRFFVTATLAVVDFRSGVLELTNAAHPPTYLLRQGAVREILLPGNPLGALGESYGRQRVELEAGDLVVWLSDGLIEAADPAGEPFGYRRVEAALAGAAAGVAEVRTRLLTAVQRHTGGRPAEDDRTLVAMRYLVPDPEATPAADGGSTPSDA